MPVYPRKLLLMALALGLGLVLGVAFAALMEWTSDIIRDAGDVSAATDLPCLATFGDAGQTAGTA
jgi:capsular polysaccharide biosynthesis protein